MEETHIIKTLMLHTVIKTLIKATNGHVALN